MASLVHAPRAVRGLLAVLGVGSAVYVAYAALGLHEHEALATITGTFDPVIVAAFLAELGEQNVAALA